MDNDQHVAQQFADGDLEALGVIIDRYQARLYRMGLKLFRHEAEAADFCQDAFLHAFEKRKHFNPNKPFQPWFLKVALNVGRMRLRKKKEIPMGDKLPEGEAMAVGEQELIKVEETDLVRQALQKLSPKYYESLLLRFEGDLSLKEMASVLACSIGTVKSRLNRGLIKFRQAYQALGGDDV